MRRVILIPVVSFVSLLSPANEVPPTASAAPHTKAESRAVERSKSQAPPTRVTETAIDDRKIETEIAGRLAKSKIGADGFTVRVQGGVAYWSGSTSVPQHKGAATRMAKAAGARRVVNAIKVTDEGRAKAGENMVSGRRRVQVKRTESRTQ